MVFLDEGEELVDGLAQAPRRVGDHHPRLLDDLEHLLHVVLVLGRVGAHGLDARLVLFGFGFVVRDLLDEAPRDRHLCGDDR